MDKLLIEICCGSAEDVINAQQGGADRVELNSSLFLGGLTPTLGTLRIAKERTTLPVMCMVRPRQGGFCYDEVDYAVAKADAKLLLDNGSDGLVFGFLHEDGTLDHERCRELIALCEGRSTVFHRAIDVVPDWKRTLSDLIDLGVTRVLTSGQAPNVLYGAPVIREMIAFAGGAIEILPGGGVDTYTIDRIVRETGAKQVHFATPGAKRDSSVCHNPDITFGGALNPPEDSYGVVDSGYIGTMRKHCI